MTRYHPILVALHWLLALMILLALVAGNVLLEAVPNSDPAKVDGLRNHMSLGLAILVLMVVRLVVRLVTAHPPAADIGSPLLNLLARWGHWGFYILVLAMVGSGMAMSAMAGLPDIVFNGSGAPLPESFDDLAPRAAHGVISILLMLLILGHVGAAVYHQVIRRDGLMARMGFGRRGG